jgi:hypothetical protein
MLSDEFSKLYTPLHHLAMDEGMLAWRGQLQFQVYNPSTIVKYGIMVRTLHAVMIEKESNLFSCISLI